MEERAEKAVKSSNSKKSTKKQGVFSWFSNLPANSRSAFTSPQFQDGSSSLVPWRNQSSAFICSSERPSSRPGNCFACGKFGHWRSECHQRGASSKVQSNNRWLLAEEESKPNSVLYSPCDSEEFVTQEHEQRSFEIQLESDLGDLEHVSVKGRLSKSIQYTYIYIHTLLSFPKGTFRRQYIVTKTTILQLNNKILQLIILHSNKDIHEFENSTINLRFNAFLKIEIVLLSFKVRSNEFQMVVVL